METLIKIIKCTFSIMISATVFFLWSLMDDAPASETIFIIIPASLGIGWILYQVVFVKWDNIKRNKGIKFWDLVILSIQGIVIIFACMFILLWLKK